MKGRDIVQSAIVIYVLGVSTHFPFPLTSSSQGVSTVNRTSMNVRLTPVVLVHYLMTTFIGPLLRWAAIR